MAWREYTNEYGKLRTRCLNLISVYIDNKDRARLKSIANLTEKEEKNLILKLLRNLIGEYDKEYMDRIFANIPSLTINKKSDNYIYTLNGQRIDSTKPLKHGIYIHSGNKIIIK